MLWKSPLFLPPRSTDASGNHSHILRQQPGERNKEKKEHEKGAKTRNGSAISARPVHVHQPRSTAFANTTVKNAPRYHTTHHTTSLLPPNAFSGTKRQEEVKELVVSLSPSYHADQSTLSATYGGDYYFHGSRKERFEAFKSARGRCVGIVPASRPDMHNNYQ